MDDDNDRLSRRGRWTPGGSGRRFVAAKDFEHEPFAYFAGLVYTADSKALDELVDQWLEKGLVTLGSAAATVEGGGTNGRDPSSSD